MVRFDEVSKVYATSRGPVNSLDRLTIEIRAGEFVAVRGPSGCGKTTLLLTAGGMLRPTSGKVTVDGQDLYALPPPERARYRARKLGFVFQMFHLIPYLDVLENVLLAASPAGKGLGTERAAQLIDQLGLTPRSRHKPPELSTGERQRTAIARALLNRPQLILADEPTGNLDPENAGEVFRHLKDFQGGGGTVLVVTHGDAATAFADRIIELRAGQVATA